MVIVKVNSVGLDNQRKNILGLELKIDIKWAIFWISIFEGEC